MENDINSLKEYEDARTIETDSDPSRLQTLKKAVSAESFVFIGIMFVLFGVVGSIMGGANMINTIMNTANLLLIETVFYILAIAVLAGALSGLLSEFGVVSIINKFLSPIMNPLYGLPGAATIGILTCYLSDNPAILTLADDDGFRRFFKKYQLPALTNIGTSFGMGLIVTSFMIGINSPTGENFAFAALIGTVGAIIGSVISTRIMLFFTSKEYGTTEYCVSGNDKIIDNDMLDFNYRTVRRGTILARFMEAMLAGGKIGVDMGLSVIPGVLVVCTTVLLLTNGMSDGSIYTGAAYEGIAFLPWVGEKLQFILGPLFGFSNPANIAVPITALGAAGAAIGLVPRMVVTGLANANDIAVFTAMCMCWSGYLSTHVAMMDSLKCRKLTGKAILSHTIGGMFAGISANWIFKLASLIF